MSVLSVPSVRPRVALVGLAFLVSACGGTDPATTPSASVPDPAGSTSSGNASEPAGDTASGTSGCREASRNCLGVLDPGTYSSTYLDVFGTGDAHQLTYTVGPGWANTLDHAPSYWIKPKGVYLSDEWETATSGVYVWVDVAAAVQVSTCPEESDTSVDTGAVSLAAWISRLPGLSVTKRPPTTIDGHRAIVLDVRTTGKKALCETDVPLLASRPGASDPWVNGINVSEAQRLMLFDLPGGHTTEVVVGGPRSRFEVLVGGARPVIASLRFRR